MKGSTFDASSKLMPLRALGHAPNNISIRGAAPKHQFIEHSSQAVNSSLSTSVAAPRLRQIFSTTTQGSQSLALGLSLPLLRSLSLFRGWQLAPRHVESFA